MSTLNRTVTKRENVFDPKTGTYRENIATVPDPTIEQEKQTIQNEITTVDHEITRTRDTQASLYGELAKLRTEMIAL